MPPPRQSDGVTIAHVAEMAGVSIATVSRVINGVANRAGAETSARVWAAARSLGYRPASAGQALRQRQSRLVALLAANLANPAMAAIAASLEIALRQQGLVMVLCDTHDQPTLQDEYLAEMRAQMARAIVLLGAVASPGLRRMQTDGANLLFVNRRSPEGPAPFVGIDNRQAGTDAAAFFRSQAIPAPGIVHAARTSSATADRLHAFLAALPQAKRRVATMQAATHQQIGYDCVLDVLASGRARRGIFCTSDLIAYGAHRRLSEIGLRVPHDVLLVGFDDNPLNDWIAPWLSSVAVPYPKFGPAVVAALQAIWRGEQPEIILPHRLVARTGT
jgi:LacI family transcriptional regulator